MFISRAILVVLCISGTALAGPTVATEHAPPGTPSEPKNVPAATQGRKPPGAASASPVFRLHVKTMKLKPKKIEMREGHIWEDQWRMLLLEGDPKRPTRTTPIIEGPANCGQFDRLEEEDLVDGDARVLFFMACWHGGAGYTLSFTRRGQTVAVKTATFAEEDENPIDDSKTVYTLEVPRGMRVEVVHLP